MIKTESIKIVKESVSFFLHYVSLLNFSFFLIPSPQFYYFPSSSSSIYCFLSFAHSFDFFSPRDSIKDCQLPSLVHFEAMSRGEKKMKRVGEGKKTIEWGGGGKTIETRRRRRRENNRIGRRRRRRREKIKLWRRE